MNIAIAALLLALAALVIVIRGAIIQRNMNQISLRELGTGTGLVGAVGEKKLFPSAAGGRGGYSAVNDR